MQKFVLALAMLSPLALTACGGGTPVSAEDAATAACRAQVNDDPAVQEARIKLDTGMGQLATERRNLSIAEDNAMQKCLTEHGVRFRGGVERERR